MPDLQHLVAETMADSLGGVPTDVYLATAGNVLDAVAAPSNRATLVAWLVEAGVLPAPITAETVHVDPHGTYIRIFELLCRGPRFEARKLAGALDAFEVDAILDRLAILRQVVREEHGRA